MMQSVLKNNWRETVLQVLLVLLFAGLLWSRAIASLASVLMAALWVGSGRKIAARELFAILLLLLPFFVSGFWSDDQSAWWGALSVKLPLVTMMLGLSSISLSPLRNKQIVWMLLFIVTAGCCWSLAQYSMEIQEAYLRAKTLPTLMDNDHIRFSWLAVVSALLGMHLLLLEKNRRARWVLMMVLLFIIIYLHVLAAKTGLVCLYGAAFTYLLYIVIAQRKWKMGAAIAAGTIVVAFLCYQYIPTLRNRVQYVVYDIGNVTKGNHMPGYNDAARLLSMRAGYELMSEHPLKGVGAGDVRIAINQWHEKNNPQGFLYERFLPACEWLVYGAAAGWPGFLLFTAGLALLVMGSVRKNAGSIALAFVTIVPFVVDDTLEGQYGVVILAIIVFFGQPFLSTRST